MPVTNYYTIDGQMIGYKTAAGRKDFLADALGSVTAEVDQTGNTKTFDGRYKPYGGDLTSTGTRGSYGWIGSWGYRETGLSASSHYVRARHYSKTSGGFTVHVRQSEWLAGEGPYNYSFCIPTRLIDPTGWGIEGHQCRSSDCPDDNDGPPPPPPPPSYPINIAANNVCKRIQNCFANPVCRAQALECIAENWAAAAELFHCLIQRCNSGSYNTSIFCGGFWCFRNICGFTSPNPPNGQCTIHVCTTTLHKPCHCGVSVSYEVPACEFEGSYSLEFTILHELTHCCGVPVNPDVGNEIALCFLNFHEH